MFPRDARSLRIDGLVPENFCQRHETTKGNKGHVMQSKWTHTVHDDSSIQSQKRR